MMSSWVDKNDDIFGTKGDTYTCNISPKRSDFSLSYDVVKLLIRLKLKEKRIFNLLFHFYFLIRDFSLNMSLINLRFYKLVNHNQMEVTVSRIFC